MIAFHTHHMTAAAAQVKEMPPLRGLQKTSVLADISNKSRPLNTEVDPRLPLKPSNAIRKPLKDVENEVLGLTQALNRVPINEATLKHADKNWLHDKEQTSYSSTLYNIQDIDEESANDVIFLGEYAKDIFEYLRALEKVHVMDKKKIQLLGAASLLLASKYEEIYPPEISSFVYICSNLYTKNEILQMEMQIMRTISFFVGYPLSVHFLRRYSKASSPDEVTYTLAKYFQEMCLLDYELCHFAPSCLAAAALYLALWLRRKNEHVWSETLIYYSQYKLKDIAYISKKIAFAVISIESSKYQVLYEKYSSSVFLKVSSLPEVTPVYLKRIIKLL
ncbi:G2/mitotic-specific cyclin-B-like isoform X3 [Schistocerca americana]|uniref:G2/mitotic-specific cyclin-B-like isoform X3 n=1 Tax=Schistocerca americana TaxID=7009 RepID=UPI001F4F7DC6|nr:G2/mitotic-specific cyclin-B-like isoform X3 [Schistocerca americana]